MKTVKFSIILVLTFSINLTFAQMTCEDVEKNITKEADKAYAPFIKDVELTIAAIRQNNADPCSYYNPASRETEDWCSYLVALKTAKSEAINKAKKDIDCYDNNTEITTQNILDVTNEAAVFIMSKYLGVQLPEKTFYVSIIDIKKHGILGGPNSLYNAFKDQAEEFKNSLPKIDKVEIKINETEIIPITNKGGTNKHGLPDIKIGKGFKW